MPGRAKANRESVLMDPIGTPSAALTALLLAGVTGLLRKDQTQCTSPPGAQRIVLRHRRVPRCAPGGPGTGPGRARLASSSVAARCAWATRRDRCAGRCAAHRQVVAAGASPSCWSSRWPRPGVGPDKRPVYHLVIAAKKDAETGEMVDWHLSDEAWRDLAATYLGRPADGSPAAPTPPPSAPARPGRRTRRPGSTSGLRRRRPSCRAGPVAYR